MSNVTFDKTMKQVALTNWCRLFDAKAFKAAAVAELQEVMEGVWKEACARCHRNEMLLKSERKRLGIPEFVDMEHMLDESDPRIAPYEQAVKDCSDYCVIVRNMIDGMVDGDFDGF